VALLRGRSSPRVATTDHAYDAAQHDLRRSRVCSLRCGLFSLRAAPTDHAIGKTQHDPRRPAACSLWRGLFSPRFPETNRRMIAHLHPHSSCI
jgi:hypothetical protein